MKLGQYNFPVFEPTLEETAGMVLFGSRPDYRPKAASWITTARWLESDVTEIQWRQRHKIPGMLVVRLMRRNDADS